MSRVFTLRLGGEAKRSEVGSVMSAIQRRAGLDTWRHTQVFSESMPALKKTLLASRPAVVIPLGRKNTVLTDCLVRDAHHAAHRVPPECAGKRWGLFLVS